MKKKIILSAILSIELLYGIDVRFGKGKFDMDLKMMSIFNINESIDINTLTLANPHDNFGDTNYYFFYDADVYQSDYIDTMADMIKIPLDNIPGFSDIPGVSNVSNMTDSANIPTISSFANGADILPIQNRNIISDTVNRIEKVTDIIKDTTKGSIDKVTDTVKQTNKEIEQTGKKVIENTTNSVTKTTSNIIDKGKNMIPTPFDVKVKGFDMNIGAGYDIYKDSHGYFGIGAATGLSLPYIYMKNKPLATMPILTGLMQSTNTSLTTYKASLSMQGSYMILDGLNVDAVMLYGYQFGKIDNDWFASEVDIDGTTSMLGFSMSYNLGYLVRWADGLTVSAGYTRKSWDLSHTDVKLMGGLLNSDLSQPLDAKFDTENYYFGIGYRF